MVISTNLQIFSIVYGCFVGQITNFDQNSWRHQFWGDKGQFLQKQKLNPYRLVVKVNENVDIFYFFTIFEFLSGSNPIIANETFLQPR
jgi:hypothetical protein